MIVMFIAGKTDAQWVMKELVHYKDSTPMFGWPNFWKFPSLKHYSRNAHSMNLNVSNIFHAKKSNKVDVIGALFWSLNLVLPLRRSLYCCGVIPINLSFITIMIYEMSLGFSERSVSSMHTLMFFFMRCGTNFSAMQHMHFRQNSLANPVWLTKSFTIMNCLKTSWIFSLSLAMFTLCCELKGI